MAIPLHWQQKHTNSVFPPFLSVASDVWVQRHGCASARDGSQTVPQQTLTRAHTCHFARTFLATRKKGRTLSSCFCWLLRPVSPVFLRGSPSHASPQQTSGNHWNENDERHEGAATQRLLSRTYPCVLEGIVFWGLGIRCTLRFILLGLPQWLRGAARVGHCMPGVEVESSMSAVSLRLRRVHSESVALPA